MSQNDHNLLKHTTTATYLICKLFDKPYKQICPKCGNTTFNNVEHVLLNCIYNNDKRYRLWRKLLEKFVFLFYKLLLSMPPRLQLLHMFSGTKYFLNSDDSLDCLKLCISAFYQMWSN